MFAVRVFSEQIAKTLLRVARNRVKMQVTLVLIRPISALTYVIVLQVTGVQLCVIYAQVIHTSV